MMKVFTIVGCLLGLGLAGLAPVDTLGILCGERPCPMEIWSNPQASLETPLYILEDLDGDQLEDLLAKYGSLFVKVRGQDPLFRKQISDGDNQDDSSGCRSQARPKLLVQLVGFTQNHWIIYNYQQKNWGRNGYGFIARDTGNSCGITTKAYWANIGNEQVNILPSNRCVQTDLGMACIINIGSPIPNDWRLMKLDEGKLVKESLNTLLDPYSIVAFQTGKLDGTAYGNVFSDTYGPEVGEVFILRPPLQDRCVETNIGLVCIEDVEAGTLPKGWRVVRQYEGESVKERLSLLLYEWDIVSFSSGALGGSGYNYEIRDSFPGEEIDEVFIVKIDPTTPFGTCVPTPIGIVCKVKINLDLSVTWRKVTLDEGKTIKEDLNKIMDYWGIVAFETGKLDGFGYGNVFSDTYGPEAGEVFITRAYNHV